MTSHRLKTDAKNRTARTFLQGIGFTVLAAIVMVLYPVITGAHSWSDFHWTLIGFALIQAVGTAVLAYIMRAFLDPSAIPTPLPPADSGQPVDPEAGQVDVLAIVLLLTILDTIGIALLLFRVRFGG